MKKVSQNQKILDHMLSGKSIDPMQALRKMGCFRLAARINDLRDMGYRIDTVRVFNRRTKKHYAEYLIGKK